MSQLTQPTNDEDPICCLECNGSFPKKAKPGPCGRCFMIELVVKKDGIKSVWYQNLICHRCEAVGKNFIGGYCYNCHLPEDDAAEQTCISQFQAQMQEGKQCQELNHHSGQHCREPGLLFIPPPPPLLPLNSESLNRHNNIDLFQLKKGPIALLGPSNSSQFPDRFVPSNKFDFHEGAQGRSRTYEKLHKVYNEHMNQPDTHEVFGPEVVKKKAGAGVTMHWELLINVAKYKQQTGYIIPPQLGGSGQKQGHVEQQDDDEQAPLAKRTALHVSPVCPVTSYQMTPMHTQFRNPVQKPDQPRTIGNKSQPILNNDSCCYSWNPPQDGMLNDVFTSKGHLKKVYQYNNCQLEAEVLTQKLGAYMLEGFYCQVENARFMLEEDPLHSQSAFWPERLFIPQEALYRLHLLSHYKQDDPNIEVIWLVEPLYVTQDQKWSTQLMFNIPNLGHKQMIMDAFAH
ncbi:hypothetical protein IW262DRAFT_1302062 [Armillaria fumosa]|nr:hypothetical protein IW262DRAFT_1302062 [Armillaria fumosa]